MKKSTMILAGFFVLAMLDSIFAYAMPADFTFQRVSVLWHFFLIGLLIFVRDKPLTTRVLIGISGGLFYDMLITSTFPVCTILYALLCLLAGAIPYVLRRNGLLVGWCVFLLFLADLLPALFANEGGRGHLPVSFLSWMYHFELLTLIFDALCVIGLLYVDLVMTRYYLFQSRKSTSSSVRSLAPKLRTANSNHPHRNRQSKKRAGRR